MAIIYSYPLVSSLDSSDLFPLTATNEEEELYVANVTFSTLASEIIDEAFNGTDRYIPRFDGTSSLINSVIYEDSNSNIGIGTTSPTYKLQVVGNGAFNSTLGVQDPAVSSNGLLQLSHDSTGSSLYSNPASSNVSTVVLRLGINYSEKMRIANNGNVGIGTTSPQKALDVNGDARFTGAIDVEGTTFLSGPITCEDTINMTGNGRIISLEDPQDNQDAATKNYVDNALTSKVSTTGDTMTGTLFMNKSGSGHINVLNSNAVFGTHYTGQDVWIYAQSGRDILLGGGIGTFQNDVNVGNGDLIVPNGYVGIGTTSPASKLEVDGGDIEIDNSASGLILRSPNGTRYRVQVDNSGNLITTAI